MRFFLSQYEKQVNFILLVLSILYLSFVCVYSINQYDLGFILSMVGRLKSGQIIYQDFDYVRPFFGVVFWDYLLYFIPISSKYLVLFSRILVVFEVIAICHLLQKILFKNSKLTFTLFFAICFLHTFPIMIWHTIDGILFGVISIYFLQKKWHFSSLLLLLFAALTKQSFVIFGLGVFIILVKDFCKDFKFNKKDFLLFSFGILFLIIILFQYHILENYKLFLEQVFSSSTPSGFYKNSIEPYLFEKNWQSILLLLGLITLYFIKVKREILEFIVFILFPILVLIPIFNDGVFLGIYSMLLILIVLFLKFEPKNKVIFLMIFLAWSAGISWGYNSPIFLVFILMLKFIETKKQYFYLLWIIVLISFLFSRLKNTYLSDSIFTTKYVFVENMPSISGLLISENEKKYVAEANSIEKKYKNVVFLPGSPILDLINGKFLNRASWEMDVEYPNLEKDTQSLKQNILAIDKKQLPMFKDGFYKSSFTFEIINKFVYSWCII